MVTLRFRPLIGLTVSRHTAAWWAWEREAALVPATYIDVVEASGGQPVLVPPKRTVAPADHHPAATNGVSGPDEDFGRLLAVLDGLVLTGGGDLAADRYGQRADPHNDATSQSRDELEIGLVRAALSVDLPVLAVCRGLQILNVALGGDLVQHLPGAVGSAHRPRPGEFGPVQVRTEPSTLLRRLIGERADVRCSHHQAIGAPAPGLVVTARSGDGVIEGVELPGHRFVVGVQWHPEEDGDTRLFEALVAAAASAVDRTPDAAQARP